MSNPSPSPTPSPSPSPRPRPRSSPSPSPNPNQVNDPCEYRDLAAVRPEMVTKLTARLAQLQAAAVPPVAPEGCLPVIVDGAWRPCDAPSPFGPGSSAGQPIELVA